MQKLEIISWDVQETCFFKIGTFLWSWLIHGFAVCMSTAEKVKSDEDTKTIIDLTDVVTLK